MELGYADIKRHRALRGFPSFGRKRARLQAGRGILASDGLKLIRILQQCPNIPSPSETLAD